MSLWEFREWIESAIPAWLVVGLTAIAIGAWFMWWLAERRDPR